MWPPLSPHQAEPITQQSVEAFSNRFAPFGFNRAAFKPGYGLAEHTVYVSDAGNGFVTVDKRILEAENRVVEVPDDSPMHSDSAAVSVIAACGRPTAAIRAEEVEQGAAAGDLPVGIDIRVVGLREGESTAVECQEGHVGEVWVTSPSKAAGYWGLPELTKEAFHAKLGGGEGGTDVEYLRTGDLGFMLRGQLYICGREKDLIIVRGRNYYPQDLEATAERDDRIRPGCTAAFTVPITAIGSSVSSPRRPAADQHDDAEGVVLVAEIRDAEMKDPGSVAAMIRQELLREHGVAPIAVLLLRPKTVRKTTSGKIARRWNRLAFLQLQQPAEHGKSPWLGQGRGQAAIVLEWCDRGAASGGLEVTDDLAESDVGTPVSDPEQGGGGGGATPGGTSTGTGKPITVTVTPREPGAGPRTNPGSAYSQDLDLRAIIRDKAALEGLLLDEVRRLAAGAPVTRSTSFFDLGLDSMTLAELQQVLLGRYGLAVEDQAMYDEGTSVAWVVRHRKRLRQAAYRQQAAGHGGQAGHDETGHGGVSARGAAPLPDDDLASVSDGEGEGSGDAPSQQEMGGGGSRPGPSRVAQPGVCEKYFPCCVCCYTSAAVKQQRQRRAGGNNSSQV